MDIWVYSLQLQCMKNCKDTVNIYMLQTQGYGEGYFIIKFYKKFIKDENIFQYTHIWNKKFHLQNYLCKLYTTLSNTFIVLIWFEHLLPFILFFP